MKNPLHFFKKREKKESGLTAHAGSAVGTARQSAERPGRRPRLKKPVKPDRYYGKLSSASRLIQYIVTFTLLVFATGMPFLFSDEITAENFGLLLRNISFSFPGEQVEFTTVRYDADLAMDFAAYKEYFAVATTSGVRLYDHRGHIALDEKLGMSDPVLDAGDRYVLAYDREGRDFALFNSISLLYTGKEESAIHCADLCDEGSFLVVTGSTSSKSVIKVYNRAFNLQRELKIDRYPLSAGLAPDGKTMLFLSCDTTDGGEMAGYVTLYDLGDKTSLVLEKKHNGLPLYGAPLKDGAVVVFEDGVYFYGKDGTQRKVCAFDGAAPCRAASSKSLLALAFEENGVTGEYTLMLMSLGDGKILLECGYEGRIRGLFACEDTAWLVDDEQTTVFDPAKEEPEVHKGARPLNIVCSEDATVFACFANKAQVVGKVEQSLSEQEQNNEDGTPSHTAGEQAPDHTQEPAEESANGKKVS